MNRIQDYLLIGNLHTAALVSKKGSIDWLCYPHFDSPSIFARLLDGDGGSFSIKNEDVDIEARYIKDTAIVEHICRGKGNAFIVRDFMVPHQQELCDNHFLIRKIVGLQGSPVVSFNFDPRPDYGKNSIEMKQGKNILYAVFDRGQIRLNLPGQAKVRKQGKGYIIDIPVEKGQEKEIVLELDLEKSECGPGDDFEERTREFWKKWLSQGKFIGFCREQMVRSAITLKLMQYYPTGAIVAAPTTSLPEEIGGERNWDYRYTWIRDATFTLYAFHIMGFRDELIRFFDFIENIAEECRECGGAVHLMYTIKGKKVPREQELMHMDGFRGSSPVRIGNAAYDQFQLDVYGSLIDSYYFMWRRGGLVLSDKARRIVVSLVGYIGDVWLHKDEGIWEMRSGREHFTYSKVMAWVGVNRALRMARVLGIEGDKKKQWSRLERTIKQWIWKNCYDEKMGSFTQHPDTVYQDSTNFLFVLLQFLNRHEARTKDIILSTCRELSYKKSFVYRYLVDDSLEGKEGAFMLCTFWMMAALAAVEETDEALKHYYNIRKYTDKTMLIAEEIDPDSGEYLGNFPQAFSHMGLILASYFIDRYRKRTDK